LVEVVANVFRERGYEVTINGRFIGGEIVLRYGWPEIRQHALQIELRRDLYMNETTREKTERFQTMQQDCASVAQAIAKYVRNQITS